MTRKLESTALESAAGMMRRRDFLKITVGASGGLLIGLYLPGLARQAQASGEFAPNAFVRIGHDGAVRVVVNHSEMGQGVYTALPQILADELDADWKKVWFEPAPVDPVYNHPVFNIQMTGGSTSTWSSFEEFRKAGAAARELLLQAAALEWKVEPGKCRTENGMVIEGGSNRRLSYGALVDRAATLKPAQQVKLKDPKEFTLIGKPLKRLDTPEKTNGSAVFGIDVKRPGMLTAVVARAPVFGAKVKSFNADKSLAVRGVRKVVEVPSGVAVVAEGFWPAKQGRDALHVDWDLGSMADFSTVSQSKQYAELARQSGAVAKKEGDAAGVLASSAKKLEAVYEVPYLSHAMMEPLNCAVELKADHCEIWTGTQFQTVDRAAAAEVAGLKPEQVQIHTTLLGGGFGRRACPESDFVREAVAVAKAAGAPVKVIWTREDDMHGGWYRPAYYHALQGGIDADGWPAAWQWRIVGQSIIAGTPFAKIMVKNGIDPTFGGGRGGHGVRDAQPDGGAAHDSPGHSAAVVAVGGALA